MLVKELIEWLEEMPQDAEVMFQYNFGDYWRTQVAEEVKKVEQLAVEYSDYHRMHKIAEECEYDEELSGGGEKQVVVLG